MKIKTILFLSSILCMSILPVRAQDDPLSQWTWRSPLPGFNALFGIAYGTNEYVAVGGNGTILTSPDGTNWTDRPSGTYTTLWGVVYGNNEFVAVGGTASPSGTSDTILTSPDGVFWTFYTSGGNDSLQNITFGNNQFVAVGNTPETQVGVIVTSTDGVNWTNRITVPNNVLYGAGFGNNKFVVGGYDQDILSGSIFISSDGVNWTNCPLGSSTGGYCMGGVAYGNGLFVAEGGNVMLSSPDGVNWTPSSALGDPNLWSVAYGNNEFVAVGSWGSCLVSSDGVTWTTESPGTGATATCIAYGSNQFVAVGCTPNGAAATILTSPDGGTWTDPISETAAEYTLNAVAYASNLFVTVGYEDVYTNYEGSTNESYTIAGVILTSPDGAAWTSQDSGAAALLKGVAGGNNVFVAVGDEDVIVTSSDGVNWTNRGAITTDTNSPLPGPDLLAVAFGSNQFVAVGYDVYGGASPILTSADGVSWTSRSSNTSNSLSAVTWGGNQFVAVGDAGEILSSPDGVGWTSRFSETNANLSAVAYGSNMFVAVGYKEVYTYTNSDEGGTNVGYTITTIDEIILTSPNGATWTAHSSTNDFNSIAWGGNEFAATSLNGAISTSPDGINWTNRVPGNGIALLGATFGESTFVVVGDSGSILQSAVLATPALGLPNMVPSGGARLTITGKPGRPYSIEASTDLLHWVNLTNVTLRTPSGTFVDPSVAGYSHRFYRIIPK